MSLSIPLTHLPIHRPKKTFKFSRRFQLKNLARNPLIGYKSQLHSRPLIVHRLNNNFKDQKRNRDESKKRGDKRRASHKSFSLEQNRRRFLIKRTRTFSAMHHLFRWLFLRRQMLLSILISFLKSKGRRMKKQHKQQCYNGFTRLKGQKWKTFPFQRIQRRTKKSEWETKKGTVAGLKDTIKDYLCARGGEKDTELWKIDFLFLLVLYFRIFKDCAYH